MLAELMLGVIAGFIAHKTRPILKRDFEGGWFDVACYAEGILIIVPIFLLIKRDIKNDAAALLLASGVVGSGVVAGHYLEPD